MSALSITAAPPAERRAALELLFARSPEAERSAQVDDVLTACARGDVSLDGLLLARRDGKPAGALLFVLHPGATAFLWPPVVLDESDQELAAALVTDAGDRLDAAGVTLAQALLEPQQTAERAVLERNGFPHVADLLYLQRWLGDPLPRDEEGLERLVFQPALADRFAAVLERTYVGSRDCPALQGKRRGADALASHRATGEFDPSRWAIYRTGGTDIGVLLLTDHPDQNAWEVVYMGVVPQARGRGYGRLLLRDALHRARRSGRDWLLLAVDSRNHYARRLYDELGFREFAVRSVHVRTPADGAT